MTCNYNYLFLSGYWFWKLINILYYCDYVAIICLIPWYHDWSTKKIEFCITKTTISMIQQMFQWMIRWIIKKAREFQKNIYFCFIDYAKAYVWMEHNKLWKILKEMGISNQLTCLLRNLYAGQEATVRTGHGTTDWLQIGRGMHQGCILSPCLFNSYAEYIIRNAGLDEAQAGIKIARRNINNLRYADDTTLMAESEEELKSLLMKVGGEWKSWLKTQHSEN